MEPMGDQGVSTQLLVPSGSVCFSYVGAPWRLFLRKEVGAGGGGLAAAEGWQVVGGGPASPHTRTLGLPPHNPPPQAWFSFWV